MENYFLITILYIIISSQYSFAFSQMTQEIKLKNIEILYISPFEISSQKPIIRANNIFFVQNNQLKSMDLEKLNSKEINDVNIGSAYENLVGLTMSKDNLELLVSNGNKLQIWEGTSSNEFDDKPLYDNNFEDFNCEENKDSLKVELYHQNEKNDYEIGIYNTNKKKVIVLDLLKIEKNFTKETIAGEFSMENNIAQIFIYHVYDYGNKSKTKLMVVDQNGNIKIWSVGVFIEHFSRSYYKYVNPMSNTFQLNENCPDLTYNQDICGFIGEKRDIILYMGKKNFTVIHLGSGHFYLKSFKIPNPINNASTLLVLDNGDALVGTKNGYIYLIKYVYDIDYKHINVLDKYNICGGSPVKHITYDKNCTKNSENCYIFLVNCGNLKVFKIGEPQNFIFKYKIIIFVIIICSIIIIIIFIYKKIKNSPKDQKDEEIELTEK